MVSPLLEAPTPKSREQRFRERDPALLTVENPVRERSSILAAPRLRRPTRRRETHLSAERSPPKAAPRVPSADVSRRPRDPEAPRARARARRGRTARVAPRSGRPGVALRIRAADQIRLATVQRRNRLSRSKDFDTVYRRGRSVSSRYLVLHWFPRDDEPDGDPRLGLAVPRAVGSAVARNRVKRLLRESWRDLLPTVPPGP